MVPRLTDIVAKARPTALVAVIRSVRQPSMLLMLDVALPGSVGRLKAWSAAAARREFPLRHRRPIDSKTGRLTGLTRKGARRLALDPRESSMHGPAAVSTGPQLIVRPNPLDHVIAQRQTDLLTHFGIYSSYAKPPARV